MEMGSQVGDGGEAAGEIMPAKMRDHRFDEGGGLARL